VLRTRWSSVEAPRSAQAAAAAAARPEDEAGPFEPDRRPRKARMMPKSLREAVANVVHYTRQAAAC